MSLQRPLSHVALAIFLLADSCLASSYTYTEVGQGWCVHDSRDKNLPGYRKDGFTDSQCRARCDSDIHCMGYNHEGQFYKSRSLESRCFIYSTWRLPEEEFSWSGSGGTEVTGVTLIHRVTPGNDAISRLTCFKKNPPSYTNEGQGWCRDSQGKITSGYKKDEAFADSECQHQCNLDIRCVAYNQQDGQCLIHAPWRLEAPEPEWSFWFGNGATEVKTGNGVNFKGVTCYKKEVAFDASPAHTYANVGQGWCRDGQAKITTGYKKEGTTFTDSQCRARCDSDDRCIAYNQRSDQCLIHSPGRSGGPGAGWSFWSGTGGTEGTTGDGDAAGEVTTCYKKIVKQPSDGGRRLSAAADVGQAVLV